jgi:hypothetical protein
MEREECGQRQRRCRAVEHKSPIAAQADPVGIADRCHRAQSIESAPQHDDKQARIAALGSCQPWHLAPCEQRTGAEQGLATTGQMVERHAHLL